MPTPLFNPAPGFNFVVNLVDADPPGLLGELGDVGGQIASAALDVIGQLISGGFSECSGLNGEMEVETYVEGGLNANPHRFFKAPRFPNIILKSGVTGNTNLWDWYQDCLRTPATPRRKNGLITVFDRSGPLSGVVDVPLGIPGLDRTPVASWAFTGAIPERVTGPQLNAKTNEMAIESVEISHQGLERVSLMQLAGGLAGLGAGLL